MVKEIVNILEDFQLCEKIINWKVHSSIMWLVVAGIIFAIGILFVFLAVKSYKEYQKSFSDKSWDNIFSTCVTIAFIAFTLSIVIILCQVGNLISYKYFPEDVILDYVKEYLS